MSSAAAARRARSSACVCRRPASRRKASGLAELLDAKARLFGDICHTFTADLRRLLTGLFTEAGTPASVEPAEAADICIALVVGLESVSDAPQLFTPATDALLAGLLTSPLPSAPRG